MNEGFKSLKEFLEYVSSGKKFTFFGVGESKYFYLKENNILHRDGDIEEDICLTAFEDFKPWIEPKPKKNITFYRYILQDVGNPDKYYCTGWVSSNCYVGFNKIVKSESKIIQVEHDDF